MIRESPRAESSPEHVDGNKSWTIPGDSGAKSSHTGGAQQQFAFHGTYRGEWVTAQSVTAHRHHARGTNLYERGISWRKLGFPLRGQRGIRWWVLPGIVLILEHLPIELNSDEPTNIGERSLRPCHEFL